MNVIRALPVLLIVAMAGCVSADRRQTLAGLDDVKIELKDEKIEHSTEKAVENYQRYLEQDSHTKIAPEAIRRLADLKIEQAREYRERMLQAGDAPVPQVKDSADPAPAIKRESGDAFERRVTAVSRKKLSADSLPEKLPGNVVVDPGRTGALEAIGLYKSVLKRFPDFEYNDRVLYQLSRAYEELGNTEEAISILHQMEARFPGSAYIDEARFRLGEYYFARKRYDQANAAYQAIIASGPASSYFELALGKAGWTSYRQQRYQAALKFFIALLDHETGKTGSRDSTVTSTDPVRMEDIYRAISLSFSSLGGAESVAGYFRENGNRSYEEGIYRHLAEHYLATRRYNDAAETYRAFIRQYPYHPKSPYLHLRIADVYKKGGFSGYVLEARKQFALAYGLYSEYWKHNDIRAYNDVVGHLKNTLSELAGHYHALYQDKRFAKNHSENLEQAIMWYTQFLSSLPDDAMAPEMNYRLAEMLLGGKHYAQAGAEFERTAYSYGVHGRARDAGYAAVSAYRQGYEQLPAADQPGAREKIIAVSLKFADSFRGFDKVPMILAAVAEDYFQSGNYPMANQVARRLLDEYPKAEKGMRRSAWLVIAHAEFDSKNHVLAEQAYRKAVRLTNPKDPERDKLINNLAASIYRQGEQAVADADPERALGHFARVAKSAPGSDIRPTADFDAASILIQLQRWPEAALALQSFRSMFGGHKLAIDATSRLAVVFREMKQFDRAAVEFERLATGPSDESTRREALITAAEMYQAAENYPASHVSYSRYIALFPDPLEPVLEARFRIAGLYQLQGKHDAYLADLKKFIETEAGAGEKRTERTRYLAASAQLVFIEPEYEKFVAMRLAQPFRKMLQLKKNQMVHTVELCNRLLDYRVAEFTAAATYYIGDMYYRLARAMAESERPGRLSKIEAEEYELALEDQVYQVEEKAIAVHAKNRELLALGVLSPWLQKSMDRLAEMMPARYARTESETGYMQSMEVFEYHFSPVGETAAAGQPRAADANDSGAGSPGPQAGK